MLALKLKFKSITPELKEILEIKPPIRVKDVLVRQYHRKKLYELSLKSIGRIPQLDEPTEEQKRWILNRLKGPTWTWKRWYES